MRWDPVLGFCETMATLMIEFPLSTPCARWTTWERCIHVLSWGL